MLMFRDFIRFVIQVRVLACSIFLLLASWSSAQTYRLVWEDEFNQFDSADINNYNRWDINRSSWNVEVVDFPANNEIQVYRFSVPDFRRGRCRPNHATQKHLV